jgi:hypothetical protein
MNSQLQRHYFWDINNIRGQLLSILHDFKTQAPVELAAVAEMLDPLHIFEMKLTA